VNEGTPLIHPELRSAPSARTTRSAPTRSRLGGGRALPLDELPDLRLHRPLLADLGEERDGQLQVLHRFLRAALLSQEIGEVVVQRSLAVAVSLLSAECEGRPRQGFRAREISFRARRQGEVVERRDAGARVAQGVRELDARLEVVPCAGELPFALREDAEDVVRLGERTPVARPLGQRERL
jgi:hypothetical protein